MNGLAMARYGPGLSQDGATGHINILEAYLALYMPIVDQKTSQNKQQQKRQQTKTYYYLVELLLH